ncbi:MAG: hypothetical protein H0U47_08070 [Nocardioidaceae bacterium]|nr:hypothetical protein [Nocardioidaceae bacterium]MBA3797537.1 hypothetical protein [Geodermatophilaceae bacterium]
MATLRSAFAIVPESILDQVLSRRLVLLEHVRKLVGVLDAFLRRSTPDHQT